MLFDAKLSLFQKDHHQTIERVDLVGREVVLGDDHVLLTYARAAPGAQGHIGLAGVGAADHQFSGGVTGGGVQQLVLYLGEEQCGFLFAYSVIGTQGE
ncbi:hypothetical protein D3C81_2137150 [compost metagenome]